LDQKEKKQQKNGENFVVVSFAVCNIYQMLLMSWNLI